MGNARKSWAWLCVAALLCVIATLPALGGGWIYDDRVLAESQFADDWGDVWATATRNSGDYLSPGLGNERRLAGVTYRPAYMLTFVVPNVITHASPLAHHLVSLALHFACCAAVLAFAMRRSGAANALCAFPALWLMLHPGIAEAYLWISGRSDGLAGFMLALLALALTGGSRAAPLAGLCAAIGVLSKEVFVPSALILIVALLVRDWRVRWNALGAFAGLVVGLSVHTAVLVHADQEVAGLLEDARFLGWLPRGLSLAAEQLVFPRAGPMRTLAFEVEQPLRVTEWTSLLILAAILVALLRWRRWDSSLLLVGALACFLPAVYVAHTFWLGLDRYLYVPAVLLAIAGASLLDMVKDVSPAWRFGLPAAVGTAYLAGLLVMAPSYRSQDDWIGAMVKERPADPSGYLLAATTSLHRGDHASALDALHAAPPRPWPAGISRERATVEHWLGLFQESARTVQENAASTPDDPFVRVDLMTLRGAQSRFEEARAIAADLLATQGFCRYTRATVNAWIQSGRLPPEHRVAFEGVLSAHPCP